jgi:DnaK suppressor protein
MLDNKFLLAIKQQISDEIVSLQANAASREEASKTVVLDQSSTGRLTRMDAMQQQAMAKENLRRATLRLKQLKASQKRIELNEFGFCLECDEDILEGRLKANPVTTLCIACAEKKELNS